MEEELKVRLDAIEKKLNETYTSAEKTRKYFLTVIVLSIVAFVLPLVGLVFVVPSFLSTYGAIGGI